MANQYGYINRKNEENYNNFGSLMIISEYRNRKDIDIYFPKYNWTFKNADYENFKKGNIKCPYEPRNRGVGYIGEGPYIADKTSKVYREWNNMITRCYDKKQRYKNLKYINCSIDEYFLCFQNFAKWHEDNYYEIPNEKMCLDKDILIKGNKIYGPNTCIYVPQSINNLFTLSTVSRNKDLPIGVRKEGNKYYARAPHKKVSMKGYKGQATPEEAFECYKSAKEGYIKQVAEEYSSFIPESLYNALINWKIEIND